MNATAATRGSGAALAALAGAQFTVNRLASPEARAEQIR
ncbi:hypothetical protein DFR76_11628 [Nocardia pseudobrasiliensis]|uniref:Uncharacterized protein n=1 Tax=Nocardia pseudobrasiliensis TaxID=45979 RepID=A0A370HNZ4_9NOCA|nr:hypothetical protein DFR76_11628 [Nocardia pseudobrasiliensis]